VTRLAFTVALCAALAGVTGCKQGKGDRCQVTADCQGGLICSSSTGTCTDNATQGIDAEAPKMDGGVDAPRDAGPADAPPD
jgi:hypothetical protein